jgi:hypothetical protein
MWYLFQRGKFHNSDGTFEIVGYINICDITVSPNVHNQIRQVSWNISKDFT